MHGIAGIFRPESPGNATGDLELMMRCMADATGDRVHQFCRPDIGLWIGWATARDHATGIRSEWDSNGDVLLILSGEVFEGAPGVTPARGPGPLFANLAQLLSLYDERGLGFLEKLNGLFNGVLVDLRQRKAILFNDRYGIHRLYVHERADTVYFATHARSLLRILPQTRQLSTRSTGEFLSCGCVLQNRTLFEGISLLPNASAWMLSPQQPTVKTAYFQATTWEQQEPLSEQAFFETFLDTWRRVVPRYFQGSKPIGFSLTGGFDSRMILAWAPCEPGDLVTYTFNGRYRDCADVAIARKVAEVCRQPHHTIQIGPEFLSQFPALAEQAIRVSDGAMDVTGAIDLYVQQHARRLSEVRITGTNGGEILRGLVNFKPTRACQGLLDRALADQVDAAAATYAEEIAGPDLSFSTFKQSPWYMGSKFVLERSLVTLRMPYFDNDFVSLMFRAPSIVRSGNALSKAVIGDGNPDLAAIGTDRGGSSGVFPGFDRFRSKFRVLTFKTEYAYDYGMPQWLAVLDHVFAPLHLERAFLGRHKVHHFRVFYRDDLAGYVRDVLLDPSSLSRPYLCRPSVENAVNAHLDGRRNFTTEIHKLLSLELIQRHLLGSR